MNVNKKSQMYESNIQSLQQKIQEIEKSFQVLEGGIKEQPTRFKNNHDAFNRFTENTSPMGRVLYNYFWDLSSKLKKQKPKKEITTWCLI